MPSSEDLAQWPRRRGEPLVRTLRLQFVSQHPRNKMRSGSHCIINHAPHRMQQELLRCIGANDIHAHRSRQHAACMKEEMQMRATFYIHITHLSKRNGATGSLTNCQAQRTSQDAPADGEMSNRGIRLAAPHAQLERRN